MNLLKNINDAATYFNLLKHSAKFFNIILTKTIRINAK